MLRVRVLTVGLALTAAACTGGEQRGTDTDTAMGGMAPPETTTTNPPPSTTGTDTMGAMTPDTMTSSAAGALDTAASNVADAVDTMGARAGQALDRTKAAAGAGAAAVGEAASSAAVRTKLSTLSTEQVSQLQQALNDDGCNAGTVDGMVGAQTRQGVECALQKYGISDTDVDSLYRALNLNFQ